jgi:carboxypeptidase Taq
MVAYILRFELERELLGGISRCATFGWVDEKMEHLWGIRPESDRVGVLQDVLWSLGEFRILSTYAWESLRGKILHTMEGS